MQDRHGASIHLNIPFYRQHYDFTCGPACLMMAMKYLEPGCGPERIWRSISGGKQTSSLSAAPADMASHFPQQPGVSLPALPAIRGDSILWKSSIPPLDDPAMDLLRRPVFRAKNAMQKTAGPGTTGDDHRQKSSVKSLFSNHVPLIVTSSRFQRQRRPAALGCRDGYR